jgi:hypothetical protein
MTYVRGQSRRTEAQIAKTLANAMHERALLTRKLQGVTTELEALRKARDIVKQAHRDAKIIREQAYDFGLAQLDRDYPTRQDRNREREVAKTKLVKRYARERLAAATAEAAEWDAKNGKLAA